MKRFPRLAIGLDGSELDIRSMSRAELIVLRNLAHSVIMTHIYLYARTYRRKSEWPVFSSSEKAAHRLSYDVIGELFRRIT